MLIDCIMLDNCLIGCVVFSCIFFDNWNPLLLIKKRWVIAAIVSNARCHISFGHCFKCKMSYFFLYMMWLILLFCLTCYSLTLDFLANWSQDRLDFKQRTARWLWHSSDVISYNGRTMKKALDLLGQTNSADTIRSLLFFGGLSHVELLHDEISRNLPLHV